MNNIHVINLSAYKQPEVVESNQKEWVEYGANNDYFDYLIDRFNASTTNNAVISNICKLVYGRGLTATNARLKPNEYAQALALFSPEDLRKIIVDRKMLGQFALQLHYDKGHKKILKAYHIPVQLLRAEKCNKDGEIEAYYYSDNWSDTKKYEPKRISAFGFGSSEIEILYFKPYSVGLKYYSNPDYLAGLPYCELEESVSKYLNNLVNTSFSPKTIINFNNGVPSDEQQEEIKRNVTNQLTGAEGSQLIVAFNSNSESKATVESLPVSDADKQYAYVAEEALRKILLSHQVTSPLLFGIATTTGFSANADELKNSAILFDNMVIKPYQDEIIEAIETVLNFNGIDLNLTFKPLQPLDAQGNLTDNNSKAIIDGIQSLSPLVANKVIESMTANEIRALVGLSPEKGGSDLPNDPNASLSSQEIDLSGYGEEIDLSKWVLIDSFDEDGSEVFDFDKEQTTLSKVWDFVKTGVANPMAKSEQDAIVKDVKFMTRYRYSGLLRPNTRAFCKAMLSADKLYRKEDIERMSEDPLVNPNFGEGGSDTYSIFRFKGGARCRHSFKREVYASLNTDAVSPLNKDAKKILTSIAEKRGYKIRNPYEVSVQPNNLPHKGFSPNNKNLPKDAK